MPKRAYIAYQPRKIRRALRPLSWIGSALDDLRRLPESVRRSVGHALREVQCGGFPPEAKPLRGELSGVHELRVDDASGTYRAVYVHRFESFIYVLHVFQKKSTHGHSLSRRDVDLIRQRLAEAKAEEESHLRNQGDRR